MSEIETGGPAFPLADSGSDTIGTNHDHVNGLTVRDYMAAKAMQGMCAHPDTWGLGGNELAAKSYDVADAMIKARSQT